MLLGNFGTSILTRVKRWKWELVIGAAGIAIPIILVFVQPFVTKEVLQDGLFFAKANWLILCLAGVTVGLVITAFKQRSDMRKQHIEMQVLSEKIDTGRKFERFEKIDKIVYGHIEYYPLVYYSAHTDAPKGIGIRLIEEIFGNGSVISKYPKKGRWEDLVSKLSEGEYDIVATPLYETHERSKLVSFCSPIFFSDIGIFVKADSELFRGWLQNSSFEDTIKLLRRLKDSLAFTAIDGELSGKMLLKHLKVERSKVNWLSRDEASVAGLIGALVSDQMTSDLVFAEVFQAQQTDPVTNGAVINLLASKQLLYPVSFAVRKQEYVLRHFINLKLAEIDERTPGGILAFILEELKRHPDFEHFDLANVRQHFVREKPNQPTVGNPNGTGDAPDTNVQTMEAA